MAWDGLSKKSNVKMSKENRIKLSIFSYLMYPTDQPTSPPTHLSNHPYTHPKGGGVSTNHKSSNRIELYRLG